VAKLVVEGAAKAGWQQGSAGAAVARGKWRRDEKEN